MVLVLLWASFVVVGYSIGNAKGRGALGAVLGLCLGIIGVLIVACISPKRHEQPRGKGPAAKAPGARRPVHPMSPAARSTRLSRGQWAPDPHGRHRMRWWNGSAWTDEVSDGGVIFRDPLGAAPTPAAPHIPGVY
jgi:hypothetical protein